MATLHERARKAPAEQWTKREQLCLASAVLKSGDQNWISVSRQLKQLCSQEGRPQEWYSQKNCAVQYGYLLENVEATKRKKRSSENAAANASVTNTSTVEPATELLVKKLTEERSQELKTQIRKEQEEYLRLYNEIKALEASQLSDEQLLAMWQTMKKDDTLRSMDSKQESDSVATLQKPASDTKPVDMELEEIKTPSSGRPTVTIPSQPPGTSPLLSSLLKSPTTPTPPQLPTRVTAPTITTLLTSGSIPKTNQPAITLKSHIPPEEAAQMLTRPMTGPPVEGGAVGQAAAKLLLSPSQSAPTLSMLLEKNKATGSSSMATTTPAAATESKVAAAELPNTTQNTPDDSTVEFMDIDESLDITKDELLADDLDETDPNEEQQLLEVFKSIGNIDELDIDDVTAVIDDEEVDFLKDVEDVLENVAQGEAKEDEEEEVEAETEEKLDLKLKAAEEIKQELLSEASNPPPVIESKSNFHQVSDSLQQRAEQKRLESLKAESSTSDDSNDNLPLATVASMERGQSGEKVKLEQELRMKQESMLEIECRGEEMSDAEETKSATEVEILIEKATKGDAILIGTDPDENSNQSEKTGTKIEESEQTDVKEEEPCESDFQESKAEALPVGEEEMDFKDDALTSVKDEKPDEITTDTTLIAADFDEDSKEDKPLDPQATATTLNSEAATTTPASRGSKTEEDPEQSANNSINLLEMLNSSATPARPPALRKLRERDRSESPLVDDDTTTTSDHSTSNNQRSRRRYSSTPNIDSVPNSPVNSITSSSEHEERRETRGTSKKSLLNTYNALQPSKHLSIFQRIFADEQRYHDICYHPTDLPTIKKHIESGVIRTVHELQRDVMLMCTNALMLSKVDSSNYKHALALMHEVQTLREFATPPPQTSSDSKDAKSHGGSSLSSSSAHNTSGGGGSATKGRGGSRKSQRNT